MTQFYAAAEIDIGSAKLHMTLAFMGASEFNWIEIQDDLKLILAKPFFVEFGDVDYFGPDHDIEVVRVRVPDPEVKRAIDEFHRKYVQPGHISESENRLHVTSKGRSAELQTMQSYLVTHLYIKAVGAPRGSPYTFDVLFTGA